MLAARINDGVHDPIGFAGGQWNVSMYVGNDPVNYIDPSGLVGDRFEKLTREEQDLFFRSLEIQHGNYLARGIIGYAINIEDDGGPSAYDYEKELAKAKDIIKAEEERLVEAEKQRQIKKLCDRSNFPSFPEIHTDGPSYGTPKAPTGKGLAIAIFGEEDNPLYKDYSSDPNWDSYDSKNGIVTRPNTTTLGDKTVSDISIRGAPINQTSWKEILRISKPGATITYAPASGSMKRFLKQLEEGVFGGNFTYTPIIKNAEHNGEKVEVIQIQILCQEEQK